MDSSFEYHKKQAISWFSELRNEICEEIVDIEREMGGESDFDIRSWSRKDGGGGVASSIRGAVFEKAGVNISTVFGDFSDEAMKYMKLSSKERRFWATGISVVIHARSPLVPSAHMNTRFLLTDKSWFGGVADITQSVVDITAQELFHEGLKKACDDFQHDKYEEFKRNCDEYFYIPHRGKGRGSSGIFYDYLNTNDWKKDFALTKAVGMAFKERYFSIVRDKMNMSWTEEEKMKQLRKRSLYVEFNLLYDRGTKFGLMTGGDPDAILMSMPPEAVW